ELDVTHVVLDHPIGSAGGVTPSKNSKTRKTGSHCPSTRSFSSIASAATILARPTAAAATRNSQETSRSRVCMNVRFGFVATEISDQPSQSPDKSGIIGELCRIIRHLGSGIILRFRPSRRIECPGPACSRSHGTIIEIRPFRNGWQPLITKGEQHRPNEYYCDVA